jgi:hypothetical protein
MHESTAAAADGKSTSTFECEELEFLAHRTVTDSGPWLVANFKANFISGARFIADSHEAIKKRN